MPIYKGGSSAGNPKYITCVNKFCHRVYQNTTLKWTLGASLLINDASGYEDSGPITVYVFLNRAVSGGFTVDVNTQDITAVAPGDYTAVSHHTLTFTGNEGETKSFTVSPKADLIVESDETLLVYMDNLAGTSVPINISDTATVTILNEDTACLTIAANVSGAEDGGAITVSILLNADVPGGFKVDVNTQDITAVAGVDYTAVSHHTLTFTGNIWEIRAFQIMPIADSDVEPDETLLVYMDNLRDNSGPVDISNTSIVTILNDD